MTTEPEGRMTAAAAASGLLRASNADREQVIETLKAAFVQGRLTQDELATRAGLTFASQTYADLAALTADLPAGLTGATTGATPAEADQTGTAVQHRSAAKPAGLMRTKTAKVAAWGSSAIPLSAVWTAVSVSGTERFDRLAVVVITLTFGGWAAALTVKFASWQEKRTGGQQPPQRVRRDSHIRDAIQDRRPGNDLMLSAARRCSRARRRPVAVT